MADLKKIKNHLVALKESIHDSLSDLKVLENEALAEFKDIFSIEEEVDIYFNEYNIVLIDKISHDSIAPYLKEKDLVLRLEIPEHEINLWVYQYFNERVFNDYLVES